MGRTIIKTPDQIDNIREAGRYRYELMSTLRDRSRPGISLLELEEYAQGYMDQHKILGSFKGYDGFPANLCLSLNDCVVHGIPDRTVLKNGDVLKIDCGITYQKCVADAAITLVVGGDHTNPDGAHLIQVTKDALNAGLATLQPGSTLREFGETVYQHVRAHDCHIIKHLTGHGVGVQVHESPSVYNRPHPSLSKITLQPGMVLALEPITSQHSVDFVAHPGNDRNLYTEFGDLGAQREYTIAVHEESIEVLAGMRE